MMWCRVAIFLAVSVGMGASATSYEQTYCTDLKPQNTLDIEQLMGMWYGVEIIYHLRDDEGTSVYDTCPIIHLSEIFSDGRPEGFERKRRPRCLEWGANRAPPEGAVQIGTPNWAFKMTTSQPYLRPGDYGYNWNTGGSSQTGYHGGHTTYGDHDYRHLRLYWDESGNSNEYILKFNNSKRGFWTSSRPQSGTRGSGDRLPHQYDTFAGTVQVIKAVGDHLVLTFCQRLPESQLFSVVVAREPQQLGRQVLHSVHNLLNRRDLSTSVVKKVCNGAFTAEAPLGLLAAISILSYFNSMI